MSQPTKQPTYKIINGNSAEELKKFPDNHFDSVVTDPPYGINFLGKDWDKNTGEEEVYRQCLRVLKPGGHLIAFSAARTYHHLAMAVERSGFEIRDQIMWVYGSGFPKSQDIGRQIDKAAGIKKLAMINGNKNMPLQDSGGCYQKCPNCLTDTRKCVCGYRDVETDAAKQWSGWGTQLKPAHEPCVLAQKPFKDAIYRNVQKWGVGAINVDGCRVETSEDLSGLRAFGSMPTNKTDDSKGYTRPWMNDKQAILDKQNAAIDKMKNIGRFPANFIHDGSPEVVELFPNQGGEIHNKKATGNGMYGPTQTTSKRESSVKDHGSAARFFYSAKVSKSERGDNNHPTVKPVQLMRYLITLVTPAGGKVLDPFNGSGSTGMAAVELGCDYTGIELDPNYVAISERRIQAWWDKCNPNPFGNPLFSEGDGDEDGADEKDSEDSEDGDIK